jgi:hypothetical protein
MAVTSKTLARTSAATTSTTLYTQPNTTTTTVITNILVTNTTAATANFTLAFATVTSASSVTVGAYDTTVIDMKQVIPPTSPAATITGSASTTGVNFHISGVEIS